MKIESYNTVLTEIRKLRNSTNPKDATRIIFNRAIDFVSRQSQDSKKHEFQATMKRFKSFKSKLSKAKSVNGKAKILKQHKFTNPITTATAMVTSQ